MDRGKLFILIVVVLLGACISSSSEKPTSESPKEYTVESIEPVNKKAILSGFDPNIKECVVPVVNLWNDRFSKVLYKVELPSNCKTEVMILKRGNFKGKTAYFIEVSTNQGKVQGWVFESLIKFE